ncbi:hypothetical protein DOX62_006425 [Cronobacter dublinensis]
MNRKAPFIHHGDKAAGHAKRQAREPGELQQYRVLMPVMSPEHVQGCHASGIFSVDVA